MQPVALGALNPLSFVARAPAGTCDRMSKNLNPTNHMPSTDVGAFILPSVARISPLPMHPIRTCDDQRQTAMKHDLDHFDRASLAWRTNKFPDCGTRADSSTTGRTFDGRCGPTSDAGRSLEELL